MQLKVAKSPFPVHQAISRMHHTHRADVVLKTVAEHDNTQPNSDFARFSLLFNAIVTPGAPARLCGALSRAWHLLRAVFRTTLRNNQSDLPYVTD